MWDYNKIAIQKPTRMSLSKGTFLRVTKYFSLNLICILLDHYLCNPTDLHQFVFLYDLPLTKSHGSHSRKVILQHVLYLYKWVFHFKIKA